LHEVTSSSAANSGRSAADVDLSVAIGALRFRNPIIAASGTFGYGLEFAHLLDLNRLGGLVTKGLSREPIDGAPGPRLCETPSGMLNAVGLQNVGVRAFVEQKLPALRKFAVPVIANVFGTCQEDYVEVIRILEDTEGLAGYELNISCPNVKKGGLQFGNDPAMAAEVTRAARKAAVNRPLWVKLSPLVADIGLIAKAVAAEGADALTVANTYPAMAIDHRTRKSREACKAVEIPVVGLGGIETASDVLDYILMGATAVQVGTASFTDPRASERLEADVRMATFEANMLAISDLRGKFQAEIG